MNRWAILFSLLILGVFGTIIYVTSSTNNQKSSDILPSGSEKFQPISPQAQNQQQTQQTQTEQQSQQQATQWSQPEFVYPTMGVDGGIQATKSATITTSKGKITISLIGDNAPRTVKNFIDKAKSGFYKNLTFHRVEDWVVQGGDPQGNGRGGGLMQTELNKEPFVRGSLGVARGQNINASNDSQFFITKQDASWLNQQYTNFGMVTDGMDVVDKITVGDKIIDITVN